MVGERIELRERDLPQQVQAAIASEIFGSVDVKLLRPYFRYYSRQCNSVSSAHGHQLPVASHTDLLDVVQKIRLRKSHAEIKEDLISNNPTGAKENLIQNSIDLALRLLLMVDVGSFGNVYTGRDTIVWTSGTVDDFLNAVDVFSGHPELPYDGLKLENSFNVATLERFAGFNVQLTTNLRDHLLVREDIKIVTIFHHATFLQHQREFSSIFPPDLVRETLQTIALLFPKGDRKVEKWYRRTGSVNELDMAVLKCGPAVRHIEKYRFWRDRLVQLKQTFDDTRPRTVTQWWNDRRDGVQWGTFWIAILFTVFFGLVQSVEGALQVYKAYHPS